MCPQLRIALVQPDEEVASVFEEALIAAGHRVTRVSVATWGIPLLRPVPPDVVVLEYSAAGFHRLLEALDGLDVEVPVIITRFADAPAAFRRLDGSDAAGVVSRVERAAWRAAGRPPPWQIGPY